MRGPVETPWLRKLAHCPGASVRLICMPPAGGTLLEYQHWPDDLPEAEVWGAMLPGRAERYAERAPDSIHESADAIVDAILETNGANELPCALFGHSFGSLLAFEVARGLRRKTGRAPALLAVSGYRAAHQSVLERLADLPQAELFAHIAFLWGGELPGGQQMMAAIEPALRADLKCCNEYRYVDEPPLDCPASLFGSHKDPLVSPDQLAAWRDLVTSRVRMRKFTGGHFYMIWHRRVLLQFLATDLRDALKGVDGGLCCNPLSR